MASSSSASRVSVSGAFGLQSQVLYASFRQCSPMPIPSTKENYNCCNQSLKANMSCKRKTIKIIGNEGLKK
jgi:hypothetical protein